MRQYLLHFVGKGLYNRASFIKESKRYGANRCFPPSLVKGMEWGQVILLAHYEPPTEEHGSRARVFGYYNITGLNFECESKGEFMEKLTQQLDIVSIGNTKPQRIHRRCGSYTISSTVFVRDSLSDIITKAQAVAEELGVKFKVFANGIFHELADKVIEPLKFARGGLRIELDEQIEGKRIRKKEVGFIGDYEQRKYLLKRQRDNEMLPPYDETGRGGSSDE